MKKTITLLLLLFAGITATAQVWKNLGSPGFTMGNTQYNSLKFSASGTPYLAFIDYGNDAKASVMKFNGTSWEYVGTPGLSPGFTYDVNLVFGPDDIPYISYIYDNNHINTLAVIKFIENEWQSVDTSGSPVNSYDSSLAIDASGSPYIAYADWNNESKAGVIKFNGTSWEQVGIAGFSAGHADYLSIEFDASGILYAGYVDTVQSYSATVMKFDGISWENVGNPGFSTHEIYKFSFALDPSGTPHVAYIESNTDKAVMMSFDGETWNSVGTSGISDNVDYGELSMCFSPSGTPYAAYSYDDSVAVRKFNGNDWENAGVAGFSAGSPLSISIAIDNSGAVGVGFSDNSDGRRAAVIKLCPDCIPTTTISSGYCGIILWQINAEIEADPVQNAQKYQFRVSDGSNTYTVVRPDTIFRLNMLPTYAYDTNYTIQVAAMVNNHWGDFGEVCNISTPRAETGLRNEDCNSMASFNTNLYADALPLVTGYRFRITDVYGFEQTIDKTSPYFRLNELPSYQYETIYTIDVAAKINGAWGEYASSCTVTTPELPVTQLNAASCGTTVATFSTNLYADPVATATGYRFRVTYGGIEQTVESTNSYFRLNQLSSYLYGIDYSVAVAVKLNGVYGNYGPECTVNTPAIPATQLRAQDCGATVASLSTTLYAIPVALADRYRFTVTNGGNVQIIEGTASYFRLNQLSVYGYNQTYSVEVAPRVNGLYWADGAVRCYVTTPAAITQLKAQDCGSTVANFKTNLHAAAMPLAEGYRFRITNGANVQTVEGTASYFRLNQLANYEYSTAYTVEVAVMTGGNYGNYGPACTVNTPAAPLTRLRAQDCGSIVVGFGANLYADAVPLAQAYRFRVMDGSTEYIVDRPNKNFRINMLPSYQYHTLYSIEVAVLVDGVWGEYGVQCPIFVTDALPPARMNMAANEEGAVTETSLTAFPNPFETSFTLVLETASDEVVAIQAYDITGKMLDNRSVAPEELSELKIGENYAAGIYSVIVTQGSYTKVVKMVKK